MAPPFNRLADGIDEVGGIEGLDDEVACPVADGFLMILLGPVGGYDNDLNIGIAFFDLFQDFNP